LFWFRRTQCCHVGALPDSSSTRLTGGGLRLTAVKEQASTGQRWFLHSCACPDVDVGLRETADVAHQLEAATVKDAIDQVARLHAGTQTSDERLQLHTCVTGQPYSEFDQSVSRLIDELRVAQSTSEQMMATAPFESAHFASSVSSRIWELLDDLGCCE
jgi:hypothetical protein